MIGAVPRTLRGQRTIERIWRIMYPVAVISGAIEFQVDLRPGARANDNYDHGQDQDNERHGNDSRRRRGQNRQKVYMHLIHRTLYFGMLFVSMIYPISFVYKVQNIYKKIWAQEFTIVSIMNQMKFITIPFIARILIWHQELLRNLIDRYRRVQRRFRRLGYFGCDLNAGFVHLLYLRLVVVGANIGISYQGEHPPIYYIFLLYKAIYELCYHSYFLVQLAVLKFYLFCNRFLRANRSALQLEQAVDPAASSFLLRVVRLHQRIGRLHRQMDIFASPFLVYSCCHFYTIAIELYSAFRAIFFTKSDFSAMRPMRIANECLSIFLLCQLADTLRRAQEILHEQLTSISISLECAALVHHRPLPSRFRRLVQELDMAVLYSKISRVDVSAYGVLRFDSSFAMTLLGDAFLTMIPFLQYFVAELWFW